MRSEVELRVRRNVKNLDEWLVIRSDNGACAKYGRNVILARCQNELDAHAVLCDKLEGLINRGYDISYQTNSTIALAR